MEIIAVKDYDTAKQWLAECEELNRQAEEEMKATGELLTAMGGEAEGENIQMLMNYGSSVLEFTTNIVSGVTEIANGINKVVETMNEAVSSLGGVFKTIVGAVTGN